jgi:hypothetical protein
VRSARALGWRSVRRSKHLAVFSRKSAPRCNRVRENAAARIVTPPSTNGASSDGGDDDGDGNGAGGSEAFFVSSIPVSSDH